jgi:hypothetical protein
VRQRSKINNAANHFPILTPLLFSPALSAFLGDEKLRRWRQLESSALTCQPQIRLRGYQYQNAQAIAAPTINRTDYPPEMLSFTVMPHAAKSRARL